MLFYKLIVDPKFYFAVCAQDLSCVHNTIAKTKILTCFVEQVKERVNISLSYLLFDRFIGQAIGITVSIFDWCGQVTKSVWGMSRCREAMKDVVGCDKPGAGV